jgi:predicted MPP superfamily phosphohydrolase
VRVWAERQKEKFYTPKRKLAAAMLSTLALAGCAYDRVDGFQSFNASTSGVTFSDRVTNRVPALENARVSGAGAELITGVADMVVDTIDSADAFANVEAENFEIAFAKFEAKGGTYYLHDPNIEAIEHVSDIHCNRPYTRTMFARIIKRFGTKIILNTGDSQNTMNTLPYDRTCYSDIIKELKSIYQTENMPVTMVNVAGNHDVKSPITASIIDESGQKHPLLTTLSKENNYRTEIDGITFVGAPDPTQSTMGPTQPIGFEAQNKVIAEQGSEIAKAACEVKDETGIAPIVAAHESPAGYETIAKGCAGTVLNGHTHTDAPVQSLETEDGMATVLQHTIGSASGADGGVPVYTTVKLRATTDVLLYNKTTHKVEGIIQTAINPNGTVIISKKTMPKISQRIVQGDIITTFLSENSEGWQAAPPS